MAVRVQVPLGVLIINAIYDKDFKKRRMDLNPNDKIVNAILSRAEKNNGECPCHNPGETHEDRLCPCKEYRENDCCHCTLYIKK